MGSSIVDFGVAKKFSKDKINVIYVLSRSNKLVDKKYKHIKINYISKSIIDLKKIPQVDYIIYCLRNDYIEISNSYFEQFLRLLKITKQKPKILFTSSGAVYGRNINKIKDVENKKISLASINNLKGYKKKYAKEKIFIENKFIELGLKNYQVSIARCYTFVGKNIIKYNFAIANLINDALKEESIRLNSTINVYRSYMHSDDMIKWLIKMLKNSNKKCPIYNLGSDKIINLRTLTKKIADSVKKRPNFKKVSSKKFDYYIPSITKAKNELKLKISINLNDALNSTIKSLNDKN